LHLPEKLPSSVSNSFLEPLLLSAFSLKQREFSLKSGKEKLKAKKIKAASFFPCSSYPRRAPNKPISGLLSFLKVFPLR